MKQSKAYLIQCCLTVNKTLQSGRKLHFGQLSFLRYSPLLSFKLLHRISKYIWKWNATDVQTCSDNRHINFVNGSLHTLIISYQNPLKNNREVYKADLQICLNRMSFSIYTYKYCPIICQRSKRNVPWWNKVLTRMRQQYKESL